MGVLLAGVWLIMIGLNLTSWIPISSIVLGVVAIIAGAVIVFEYLSPRVRG